MDKMHQWNQNCRVSRSEISEANVQFAITGGSLQEAHDGDHHRLANFGIFSLHSILPCNII
jgi:hypothetical protein